MRTHWQKIILMAVFLPNLVIAQPAIQPQLYNRWLVEQDLPQQRPTARIAGVAQYKQYTAHATLAFDCFAPRISLKLTLDPKQLAFDTDPYEGPSATVDGPITIISGNATPVHLTVGGWFNDDSPYDTGTPFIFSASPTKAQLQAWTADAVRGLDLRITVPAATRGEPALQADFRWPDDNTAFRNVMALCLKP